MTTPPLVTTVFAAQQQQQQQQAGRDVNTASLCRIGQETVQDIVLRTMEIFQLLRNMQLPNGVTYHPNTHQDRLGKLQEHLRMLSVLFRKLRLVYDKCNENCAGMDATPPERLSRSRSPAAPTRDLVPLLWSLHKTSSLGVTHYTIQPDLVPLLWSLHKTSSLGVTHYTIQPDLVPLLWSLHKTSSLGVTHYTIQPDLVPLLWSLHKTSSLGVTHYTIQPDAGSYKYELHWGLKIRTNPRAGGAHQT
ncbi:unnamed protein product [Boreogadus saida]